MFKQGWQNHSIMGSCCKCFMNSGVGSSLKFCIPRNFLLLMMSYDVSWPLVGSRSYRRIRELTKACGQDDQVHTFDQQLYAVAQQVKFARPEEFSILTLCLGPFHSACTLIGCINKLWGDCGHRDMLVDSGVYAGNSVVQMLQDEQHSRAVRGLTICYEVLSQLMLENCLVWLRSTDRLREVDEIFIQSCISARACSSDKWGIDSFVGWISIWRACEVTYFCYWDSCLTALQLLLNQIRPVRESNWDLHVISQAAALPYYFACDRPNYSPWGFLYILEMATCQMKCMQNFWLELLLLNWHRENSKV